MDAWKSIERAVRVAHKVPRTVIIDQVIDFTDLRVEGFKFIGCVCVCRGASVIQNNQFEDCFFDGEQWPLAWKHGLNAYFDYRIDKRALRHAV